MPIYTAASQDYVAVSTMLTFSEGATGSEPSDAVCVGVPIIDDGQFEETEKFYFSITAVDEDLIRVDEERSKKTLYIEDNDG